MGNRLEPQDEYMHELGPEPNFNESMYFNVYDPSTRLGGFFRLGNRANEGYAEMTVCLYLPDGRVGFMFNRPKISDNDAFDAGGIRFEEGVCPQPQVAELVAQPIQRPAGESPAVLLWAHDQGEVLEMEIVEAEAAPA